MDDDAIARQDAEEAAEAEDDTLESASNRCYDLVIAADAEAPDEIAGAAVRHAHSFYSAELVFDNDTSVLAEQQITVEHEHPLTQQYAGHFGGPYGLSAEDGGPSEVAPFVPQKLEPQGVLIPRQPERERGERGEIRHEPSGGRARRGSAESRVRGGQLTQAQLDSGQIMISKSRMPPRLLVRQVRAYLARERGMALDVRDALAITYASERYNLLAGVLDEMAPDDEIDLLRPLLTVSQAAKMLGYNAKELRRLLGQGKVAGRKVGSEWRIPLRAVL